MLTMSLTKWNYWMEEAVIYDLELRGSSSAPAPVEEGATQSKRGGTQEEEEEEVEELFTWKSLNSSKMDDLFCSTVFQWHTKGHPLGSSVHRLPFNELFHSFRDRPRSRAWMGSSNQ